jgi:hypothetical protein
MANWTPAQISSDIQAWYQGDGSTSSWNPLSLGSKLALYLNADEITGINGDTVNTWYDLSPNGFHAIKDVLESAPILSTAGPNSRKMVQFDTDFLKSAIAAGRFSSGIQTTVLFRKTGAQYANDQAVVSRATGAGTQSPLDRRDNVIRVGGAGTVQYTVPDDVGLLTNWTILSTLATPTEMGEWKDGTNRYSNLAPAYTTFVDGATNIAIGQRAATSAVGFRGDVAAIVVTDPLTDDERQLLEGYLANFAGLTANLPVNHPYNTGLPISAWNDASINNRTAVQSVLASRPLLKNIGLNGNPVVHFDAIDDFMTFSLASTVSHPFAVYAVWKDDNSGTSYLLQRNSLNYIRRLIDGRVQIGTLISAVGAMPISTWGITGVVWNGVTDSIIGVNGVEVTGNGGTTAWANTTTYMGSDASGIASLLQGDIAEILFISGLPSLSTRQKIEGYLAWKWGLSSNLPGSHPFRGYPPSFMSTDQLFAINGNWIYPPDTYQEEPLSVVGYTTGRRPIRQGLGTITFGWKTLKDANMRKLMSLYNPANPSVTLTYINKYSGTLMTKQGMMEEPLVGSRMGTFSGSVMVRFTHVKDL